MGRELAQIALRIEDRISRAATETMEQQKTQILRINANEATLKAQLVQNITSFLRKLSRLEPNPQLAKQALPMVKRISF